MRVGVGRYWHGWAPVTSRLPRVLPAVTILLSLVHFQRNRQAVGVSLRLWLRWSLGVVLVLTSSLALVRRVRIVRLRPRGRTGLGPVLIRLLGLMRRRLMVRLGLTRLVLRLTRLVRWMV